MSYKSSRAKTLGGSLNGAVSGAAVGSIIPGIGTGIGAIGGAALGGLSGFFADQSDEESMENDPEYQAAQRRERGAKMMSANLGRAFAAIRPKTMQGAVNRGI